uniref:Uncharacterized protein n=1 Tax=Romanomermis culicivorax TaxID=13658 RepID=A0A915LAG2_ROMCU
MPMDKSHLWKEREPGESQSMGTDSRRNCRFSTTWNMELVLQKGKRRTLEKDMKKPIVDRLQYKTDLIPVVLTKFMKKDRFLADSFGADTVKACPTNIKKAEYNHSGIQGYRHDSLNLLVNVQLRIKISIEMRILILPTRDKKRDSGLWTLKKLGDAIFQHFDDAKKVARTEETLEQVLPSYNHSKDQIYFIQIELISVINGSGSLLKPIEFAEFSDNSIGLTYLNSVFSQPSIFGDSVDLKVVDRQINRQVDVKKPTDYEININL